jgi:peroxiredoxin
LADYRDHYQEICTAGASVVALAVDALEKSEPMRRGLRLPFPILCDTDRHVVREWDLYNPQERGGIAKPAIFVIQPDRKISYAAVDTVATRAPASEIVRVLRAAPDAQPVRPKTYIPRPADFFRAIRGFRD